MFRQWLNHPLSPTWLKDQKKEPVLKTLIVKQKNPALAYRDTHHNYSPK
jgi:hypothetical protein